MTDKLAVVYWDSTALLSYLFRDSHSEEVKNLSRQKGVHLLTTLAIAEVFTVLSRVQREKLLPEKIIESLFEMLESGPWSRLNVTPDSLAMKRLACKWPLRGSGLWHLATAVTLRREFPELMILTYDRELVRASEGEKLKVYN